MSNHTLTKLVINAIILLIISHLCSSCASVSEPQGGEKDTKKPVLISVEPKPGTTNFSKQILRLRFNEDVTLGNYLEDIIITPSIEGGYKAKAEGKELELSFNKPLAPQTTYAILFRNAIKDLTEGNIADSCDLAFSTGPYIDSLTIHGNITNPELNTKEEGAIVALYKPSDTLDIQKHKPVYITKSDKDGNFILTYLPKSDFRIFAINDKDKDLKYNNLTEELAFLPTTINSADQEHYQLLMTKQNTERIKLFDVEAGYKSATLNFNRGVNYFSHSTASVKQPFFVRTLGKQVKLSWPTINHDSILINFTAVDSSGNKLVDKAVLKFKSKPDPEIKTQQLYTIQGNSNKLNPKEALTISVTDSITKLVKDKIIVRYGYDTVENQVSEIKLSDQNTKVSIYLKTAPKGKVRLISKAGFFLTLNDSTNRTTDTTEYQVNTEEETGVIHILSKLPANSIIELLDGQNKVVRKIGTSPKLDFSYLAPGTYTIRIISDLNNNGYWDSGNINTGQLPEPIKYYKEKIQLKANWEIEDLILE